VATPTITALIPHLALQQPVATAAAAASAAAAAARLGYQCWAILN